MKNQYLIFRIETQLYAIDCSKFDLEPTQINKVIKEKNNSSVTDSKILYKSKEVRVLDLGKLFNKKSLKKFDGLIFCSKNEKAIAIKFEGFFKYKKSLVDCILLESDFIEEYMSIPV